MTSSMTEHSAQVLASWSTYRACRLLGKPTTSPAPMARRSVDLCYVMKSVTQLALNPKT